MAKVKPNKVKELVAELKTLYLHHDSEIAGCGLFEKIKPGIPFTGSSIDRDSVMVNRIKEVILELEEEVK